MSKGTVSRRSEAGFWSSARSFFLPLGSHMDPAGVRGYPIDMRVKAGSPEWPPANLAPPGAGLYVATAQYGLGCYERWLAGDGEEWLEAALAVGRSLVSSQEPDGSWLHMFPFPHTFHLPPPWASGIAQGESASLLVRLHLETGEADLAAAAQAALRPLMTPIEQGGVRGDLDGCPWPEEYPTSPRSHVLNGAIFALWGLRDVAVGLDDASAAREFDAGIDALAANLPRYDTGYWSLYSLFPHPVKNVASSFYHALHVTQLAALQQLAPRSEFAEMRARWHDYAQSAVCRSRAFARKALFRLLVPRNQFLARRMPKTGG
jgi:heparosan-N-sulfate-glucuronate 5-epimerase